MDPYEPFKNVGPEYPKGFWQLYVVIVLLAVGVGILFLSGCTRPGTEIGNAILSHCADTAYTNGTELETFRKVGGNYNEALFDKCVNDSLFVLDQLG